MEQQRKYGFIESPKDLRDYKLDNKVFKSMALPSEFRVEHSRIKDQGMVNSCVAHSISEILETKDGINYSTGWIYGYRPFGYHQGEGMVTSQALKTVHKVGYLTNEELDVNVEMMAAKEIVDKSLAVYMDKAKARKIVSYARLNTINEIKQAIYTANKPVLVAIKIGENGLELNKKYVAYIPKGYSGGHQLVCYGWNETGLLIQNSWGENWGDKGTFILPYEYPIAEAWLINFEGDPKNQGLEVIKPNLFIFRELLMKIIKFFRNLFKKGE